MTKQSCESMVCPCGLRLPRRYAPRNDEKSGRLPRAKALAMTHGRRGCPRNDEKSGRLPRAKALAMTHGKKDALAMTHGKREGGLGKTRG